MHIARRVGAFHRRTAAALSGAADLARDAVIPVVARRKVSDRLGLAGIFSLIAGGGVALVGEIATVAGSADALAAATVVAHGAEAIVAAFRAVFLGGVDARPGFGITCAVQVALIGGRADYGIVAQALP